METITVNGKWSSAERAVSTLTDNQQYALKTHLSHLAEGEPILADLGFIKVGETIFTRGQPLTEFGDRTSGVTIYLTGLGHWQVFVHGAQTGGTRDESNLEAVVLAACGVTA